MNNTAPTFIRWLWIWITVGALVVVVVIGFLLGIVSSLSQIDEGLFEADAAVAGAGGDVKPLPDHIEDINRNLVRVDASLKPISGRADDILGALGSIRTRLTFVDSSLVDTDASLSDTDGSLVDTSGQLGNITSSLVSTSGTLGNVSGTLGNISGSLADTSGTLGTISGSLADTSGTLRRVSPSLADTADQLVNVRLLAGRIDTTLEVAQRFNSLGTNGIWRRVRFANGGPIFRLGQKGDGNGQRDDEDNSLAGPRGNPNGLAPVKIDSGSIVGGLRQVNRHLTSICEAPVLSTQAGLPGLVRGGGRGPC